jgi:hypothetical protein
VVLGKRNPWARTEGGATFKTWRLVFRLHRFAEQRCHYEEQVGAGLSVKRLGRGDGGSRRHLAHGAQAPNSEHGTGLEPA